MEFAILAGAGIVGAIVLGLGKAVMGLVRTRQTKAREDDVAEQKLSSFLFDQPRDPRTGAPATIGWTTSVDKALADLAAGQTRTTSIVNEILYELKPNGGGNFRGIVESGVDAANAEVIRVRKNEGGSA